MASKLISLVLAQLQDSVAASATFQTMVGADDAAEAEAKVYVRQRPAPATGDVYTPEEMAAFAGHALIDLAAGSLQQMQDAAGAWKWTGAVQLDLMRPIPEGKTRDQEAADWDDTVVAIWEEIGNRVWSGGYLHYESAMLKYGPGTTRETDDDEPGLGPHQWASIEFRFTQGLQ